MEETKFLLECSNCNGRVECAPDKSIDEGIFSLVYCPFCGEQDIDLEELV